jgi:hypothetical protein
MPKIFDQLFFGYCLSLGDSFVLNGVVHHYADQCYKLHVPTEPHHFEIIKTLYQDFPHIQVVPISKVEEYEPYIKSHNMSRIMLCPLNTIMINGKQIHIAWDQQYYDWFNLPFSMRYSNFRLPNYVDGSNELYNQLVINDEPYVLICNRTAHHLDGMPIDIERFRKENGLPEIKIIYLDKSLDNGNMLKWIKLIKNATEIHTVGTGFWCLVDSMFNQTQAKLFFHDARAFSYTRVNSTWNNNCWTIVNYHEKI